MILNLDRYLDDSTSDYNSSIASAQSVDDDDEDHHMSVDNISNELVNEMDADISIDVQIDDTMETPPFRGNNSPASKRCRLFE